MARLHKCLEKGGTARMTRLIESVLGGVGEMRERMRALDWSTTPLGPLEQRS